jgi:hypothetical protein
MPARDIEGHGVPERQRSQADRNNGDHVRNDRGGGGSVLRYQTVIHYVSDTGADGHEQDGGDDCIGTECWWLPAEEGNGETGQHERAEERGGRTAQCPAIPSHEV